MLRSGLGGQNGNPTSTEKEEDVAALTKVSDVDLTPIPGKQYFNLERE